MGFPASLAVNLVKPRRGTLSGGAEAALFGKVVQADLTKEYDDLSSLLSH